MCLSTTPRHAVAAAARRPAVDAAQLLSHAGIKAQYTTPQASPLEAYLRSLEPKPIAEPSLQLQSLTQPQEDQSLDKKGSHIVVQHNYHDHSHDNRADYQEEHPARGGVTTPFPLKLQEMLENVASDGHDHIVSWQPHGRCFVVHKPKEFVELLPSYFKLSKLASFQRQLNLYGFQRLTRGRDRGGYYHELFLKGKMFLAHSIQRIKVKGTGVRARSNPDQEPDFWAMPWVGEDRQAANMPTQATRQPVQQPMMAPTMGFPQLSLFGKQEDDRVRAFGDKTFHYLDQIQSAPRAPLVPSAPVVQPNFQGMDELLTSEAQSFFEGFEFDNEVGNEIEDDDVFGDMLAQMIA